MAVRFYSNLFKSYESSGGDFITGSFPMLEEGMKGEMAKEVTMEETLRALR